MHSSEDASTGAGAGATVGDGTGAVGTDTTETAEKENTAGSTRAAAPSTWYKFDDDEVTPVEEGEISSPYAYCLFYRRRP
jgi:hypothetical protein